MVPTDPWTWDLPSVAAHAAEWLHTQASEGDPPSGVTPAVSVDIAALEAVMRRLVADELGRVQAAAWQESEHAMAEAGRRESDIVDAATGEASPEAAGDAAFRYGEANGFDTVAGVLGRRMLRLRGGGADA